MTSDLDMELIKDRKKGEKNNEIDRNLTDLVSGTHTHTHTPSQMMSTDTFVVDFSF